MIPLEIAYLFLQMYDFNDKAHKQSGIYIRNRRKRFA